jgi:hypothetical protein
VVPFSTVTSVLHVYLSCVAFVQAWDVVVRCLRTRSLEETLGLAERALRKKASVVGEKKTGVVGEKIVVAELREWKFVGVRRLYTWPFGYMNTSLARKQV